MPKFVYRKRGRTKRTFNDDAMSKWYEKFGKEERRRLNARGMFAPVNDSNGPRYTGVSEQAAMFTGNMES